MLTEILVKLDLGKFTVKINHRVLLDGMMNLCGVPAGKFRTICSAIDKLDKETWETVQTEMVEDKGLDPKVQALLVRMKKPAVYLRFILECSCYISHRNKRSLNCFAWIVEDIKHYN